MQLCPSRNSGSEKSTSQTVHLAPMILILLCCGFQGNVPSTGLCLHSENLHHIMQLIRARARTFAELGKINLCGRYLRTNYMNSPKMSDCGSHVPNFTLLGCPGNESFSHFHRTRCFSLENASRNAFVVAFFILELCKTDPMLK